MRRRSRFIVGMPLAAALAHRRWRRPRDAHDAAVPPRRWRATALLCVAGCLTAVALTLVVSRLVFFDEQAIVVGAVVCALIAAARARSAAGVALSVVLAAAVAAVGGLALSNAGAIDHCFGSLSIQYAHPPAGGCLTSPDALFLRQVVLGAALVGIVFVPAGYAAGMFLRRRGRWGRRPAGVRALGWLAATVAVVAAVTGTAVWGPGASAQSVKPAGSTGSDGWIRGYDYDVRLIPNWYAVTQASRPGMVFFICPADRSYLLRLGARPAMLHGAPGLLVARSGLPRGILEQWFIVRGPVVQVVTLHQSPDWRQDSGYLRNAFGWILRTWQWKSYA